ncbi:type II secretion system F family protein [Tatumella ptyseos]|uniref:Type II secretion inner membrane protein n=2 Tax=Tatumella ptyseos TaxID=82987 RepID=A0A085JDC8_9GAMM|nr:type II secretion system F family protein [Tatumella ptyseos]KFD18474.1 type II secretion inner membrane protein [Tatumella ptyseos ATCC 33301]
MTEKRTWREYSESLSRQLALRTFSGNDRISLYDDLAFLLENQFKLADAISTLIISDRSANSPRVYCLQDIAAALTCGMSLDKGLRGWVPEQELLLLGAGVSDGDLAAAIRRAMTIARATKEMRSACSAALAYPCLLLISCLFMVQLVSHRFLPRLAVLVSEDQWQGSLQALAIISRGLSEHLILISVSALVLTGWTLWSLPNLTGRVRCHLLDHILPWKLYRDIQGVSFLLNISALLRAQVKTEQSINQLMQRASPWLYERLEATLQHVWQGKHLGAALFASGYAFPSAETVKKLRVLTAADNAENIIENFANDWLQKTVQRIKQTATMAGYVCLGLNAGYMVLILLSTQDLNNLISVHQ